MAARVATTLVTGASARERERAIADILHQNGAFFANLQNGAFSANLQNGGFSANPIGAFSAVILEGLPDGQTILHPSPSLLIERIAPGCLCCAGNLVLRVTLNRLLRRAPAKLVIGLANAGHLDQLRSWLQSPPYDQLLELGPTHHT